MQAPLAPDTNKYQEIQIKSLPTVGYQQKPECSIIYTNIYNVVSNTQYTDSSDTKPDQNTNNPKWTQCKLMTANAGHRRVPSIRSHKLSKWERSQGPAHKTEEWGVRSLGNDLVSEKKVTKSNIYQKLIKVWNQLMFTVYIQTTE